MSVDIKEVLNGAGYNLNNIQDCQWIIGQQKEFDSLVEQAENLLDSYNDYLQSKENAEDNGDYNFPEFEDWRQNV